MAYPTIDAPYGLKPINLIGGQVFAGSTREVPIQYGDATSIFYGDFVKLVRGNATRAGVTTSGTGLGLVGIFLGCSFTNPLTKQKQFAQYWPGGTLAGDAVAIIADDPDTVFKAAVVSGTTVMASGNYAMIGQNYSMVDGTGSTNTGNSANALLYSATLTTAAFPVRVVGVNPDTGAPISATGSSSSTTITLTGSGLPAAIYAGTDVAYIAGGASPTGQLIRTGSFVTTAAAAGATSITINVATSSLGNTATVIPASSTIVFTQFPEMLVKINFAVHSYYTATAV
jgi:hypothetical protein